MLTLYFTPGACSLAPHIVLEESGEKYEKHNVDMAKNEQKSEPYLKINAQGRVPALRLDDGYSLTENTAILPYLGKRFGLWPTDPIAEAKAKGIRAMLPHVDELRPIHNLDSMAELVRALSGKSTGGRAWLDRVA